MPTLQKRRTPNGLVSNAATKLWKQLALGLLIVLGTAGYLASDAARTGKAKAVNGARAGVAAARAGDTLPMLSQGEVTVNAAGRGKPYLNLQDGRELAVDYQGEPYLTTALRSGQAEARSLASADIDGNATPDVVAGYAYNGGGIISVERGNLDAFAPTDEAVFARMQQGYNPESLLPQADAYRIPESADFLQVGDFNQDNRKDVLVAARGGGLFLLAGDGEGGLNTPEQISLPGAVTAMTAGEFRAADGWTDAALCVDGPSGPLLLIYDGAAGGITGKPLEFALPAGATAARFGELDSDPFMDLAVATGGQVEIIHGWGRKQKASLTSRVEQVDAGPGVLSLDIGFFIWNREGKKQLATLSDDGTMRILRRGEQGEQPFSDEEIAVRARARLNQKRDPAGFDIERVTGWQQASAERWTTARQIAVGGIDPAANSQTLLSRSHVSPRSTDELLVLGGNERRLQIIRQADETAKDELFVEAAPSSEMAGDFATISLDTTASPVDVLALPQKLNGERSIVVLHAQSAQPTIVPVAPTATITVDRIDDPSGAALTAASVCGVNPNDCSLRGAVQFANANSGTTISLGSNTYTLSIPGVNGNGPNGCVNEPVATGNTVGDLEINTTTTVTGTGAASTIINQIGTGNVNHPGDRVICMDVSLAPGFTFSFSGLTIAGGRDVTTNIGGGGFIGGARDTTLNLTNVTFANNQTTGPNISGGGGVAVTGGNMNVTNCTFGAANLPGASRTDLTLGNASNNNSGGGLSYSPGDPLGAGGATGTLTVMGTTFTHNTSSSVSAGGGGLDVFTFNTSTGTANISTSTFSSNQATGTASGGGIINQSLTTVNISTTSFTSNSAGNRGGGIYVGGGSLLLDGTSPSITFSGNTATTAGSSISAASAVNVSGTNTTLGGDLEVTTNGIWTNNTGSTISPTNFIISGTGSFIGNNSTTNVSGNFQFQSGTFNAGTGVFNFNGTGTQSITNSSSITFNNLTDSNTMQPLTLNNSFAVGGNLTVNANAIFAPVAGAVISGGGTLTGSGTARVTRTGADAFFGQYTITNKTLTNLTVEYIGAGAQTSSTTTYGRLKINNGSGVTLGAGTTNVNGTLTLTSGALAVGANTLVINNGSSVGGGSLTSAAAGTVNYNQGSGGQSVIAANYGNLTFSNFMKVLPSGTVGIAGTFTPGSGTGHTITGNTIEFNGTSAQTLPAAFTPYNNLTLNNAAGTTGFAGLTVNALLEVKGGTFTTNSGNYNNVQIDNIAGATLAGVNSTTVNVSGNWANNGSATTSFTSNGNTVNFNGSGAQTIGGSQVTTFNNLTIANAGSGVSLIQNATVNGTLTLTNDLTTGASTLTQPSTAPASMGTGDVVGNARRTGAPLPTGTTLTFGNSLNSLLFAVAGTTPTDVTFNLVKAAPSGGQSFPSAVTRTYTITPAGGSGFSATLRLRYNDTELNSNNEAHLDLWRFNGSSWISQLQTTRNAAANWVEKSGVTAFSPWTIATHVNQSPSATNASTFVNVQTSTGLVVTPNAADVNDATVFKITNITNGTLFKQDGTTQIINGQFITLAEGQAGLKFTPTTDFNGMGSFDAQSAFDNTGAGLGSAATATITVSKYNTTTAITSDTPDPSNQGETVTVNYTVTNSSGGPTPTGNVVVTVSGGTETCTGTVADGNCSLVLNTAGNPRTITATYNGTASFNSSFITASHVVNACTNLTTAVNTNDSGAGSLRNAIASTCAGGTVNLNVPGTGPFNITLTGGELAINKDITILGPVASGVIISGNNSSRVFNISAGNVALSNLTIRQGSVNGANGAGLLNTSSGTVTLTGMTFSGNTVTSGNGGAIATTGGTLKLINSTLSGNAATGNGGALFHTTAGTVNIVNSTIANNRANSAGGGGTGGGVAAAVSGAMNLKNTLVAGNFNGISPSTTADDVNGAIAAGSLNNLIGVDTGLTGISNGTNGNQIGMAVTPINPLLGPLQPNGGPTATHALLTVSPALDAGTNAVLSAPDNLTTDQRGHGRKIGTTVDIGAVEAGVAAGDYDRDQKTEIATWSPSSGNWNIIDSRTNLQHTTFDWGRSALGDVAVPGDYDGDRKIDIAVWRPSEGNWYIIKSSDGGILLKNWGGTGDIPVRGDYDGDGRTDVAVFRPSQSNWYILNSFTNTVTVRGWGANGDKAVPADYDGDGRTDIAVFRPSEGNWYIINSLTNTIRVKTWGLSTDKAAPADYDGDGRADIAVFRPSEGNWYLLNSATNTVTVRGWGVGTDVLVPADYDGDGKVDVAVWRPVEGTWYIIQSSTNTVRTAYLGVSGDVPAPNTDLPQ